MNVTTLSEPDLALARSRTYALLGQLYAEGVTAKLLPVLRQIDELAEAIPQPYEADQAAAAYQHLFGFSVFAHESIFLDTTGLVGGAVTEKLIGHYTQLGWEPNHSSAGPDRMSDELLLLGFLCEQEAAALRQGDQAAAAHYREGQGTFLQGHLLRWVGPCMVAIQQSEDQLFGAVAQLTLELLDSHGAALSSMMGTMHVTSLPDAPDLLGDEKTSLKDIAEFLIIPAYSGLYLSRPALTTIGRRLELPTGFSWRSQMLLNMMRSAVEYETLPAFLDALRERFESWSDAYQQISQDLPSLEPFIQPWQEKVCGAIEFIGQIKTAALIDVHAEKAELN